MNLEEFAHCCGAQVCRTDNGDVELRVFCAYRDPETGEHRVLRRDIDLTPIANRVLGLLETYHAQLHGEGVSVGWGWGDLVKSAMSVAKRVGESSAVKSLYKDVAPMLASVVPGGTAALAIANQAHDIISKAREGNKRALVEVALIRKQAVQGNPEAYDLMKLMKEMSARLTAIETQGRTKVSGPLPAQFARMQRRAGRKRSRGGVRDRRGGARGAWAPGAGRGGRKLPGPAVRKFDEQQDQEQQDQQDQGYQDQQDQQDYGYQDQAGPTEGYYDQGEAEISGWLYGKRKTVADILLNPSGSPGLAARELYNRGLGDTPTTTWGVARSALRQRFGV